jgi:hypothetical protein
MTSPYNIRFRKESNAVTLLRRYSTVLQFLFIKAS